MAAVDSTPSIHSVASASFLNERPSSLHGGPDLEQARSTRTRSNNASNNTLVSPVQPLSRTSTLSDQRSHTLADVKTSSDFIVDFDGEDDPYRPTNWPFRKKLVTTLLYGLTTMGSTWASSVLV